MYISEKKLVTLFKGLKVKIQTIVGGIWKTMNDFGIVNRPDQIWNLDEP